jgi:hypothetical protein
MVFKVNAFEGAGVVFVIVLLVAEVHTEDWVTTLVTNKDVPPLLK